MTTIAVVTVTFRAGDSTVADLAALEQAREPLEDSDDARAMVVDSASGDDTVSAVRACAHSAEVIESHDNPGLAAGCNIWRKHLARSPMSTALASAALSARRPLNLLRLRCGA